MARHPTIGLTVLPIGATARLKYDVCKLLGTLARACDLGTSWEEGARQALTKPEIYSGDPDGSLCMSSASTR